MAFPQTIDLKYVNYKIKVIEEYGKIDCRAS